MRQNIGGNTALDANKNFERLDKNKFYAKLDKKFAEANISLKSLTPPAQVTEEQKELYVSARNKSEASKLKKFVNIHIITLEFKEIH
jgi:hypothetical protein